MGKDPDQGQSLVRFLNQKFTDKVSILSRESLFENDFSLANFRSNLLLTPLERSLSMHQFVQQNAQTPDINHMVVWLARNHFWRHVFQSATKRISL